MILQEMVSLFLDSRKRGTTGARKKCTAKTRDVYEANLKLFLGFLQAEVPGGGVGQYKSIKRTHLHQFMDWMDAKVTAGSWSRATVLQVLRTLRVFFRWVDKDEDCQEAELKGLQRYLPAIEKNPRRTDIPEVVELSKFKNSFNTDSKIGYRNYVVTCLLLDTGLRISEVCNLEMSHVLFDQKMLIVTGKTGTRPVAMTLDMIKLLKGWLKRRDQFPYASDSTFVFVSKYAPKMDAHGFAQVFRKHFGKNGLPRITAHTFRHAFCTNYLRKGGDMERLRMMTGHATYDMLREYVHAAQMGSVASQKELERVSLLHDV